MTASRSDGRGPAWWAGSGRPHVVVVGGGFGGLTAARGLRDAPVRVTLIDRHNHHLFQPLLYQVATAALSPGDIAVPIRGILRSQRNARVLLGEVHAIDLDRRLVRSDAGELRYDFLVVATGARHSYFGHPEWEERAPGLKTLADALEIRRRVLFAYEEAERTPDAAARDEWLTFVVVGAGPTGVELAGALAEIAQETLVRDFRLIDPRRTRILLLEAGPRVLPTFHERLSDNAAERLRRIGVDVRLNTPVTEITPAGVSAGGAWLPARTVLWGAGNQASPLGAALGVPRDRAGRVTVEPDLTIPGHPEVFVIGDLSLFTHQTGKPLPGTAAVAKQQGRAVAANIRRAVAGLPHRPFVYREQGNMATIGRRAAVADFGRLRLDGFIAWLAWLFVHLFLLIGFRNRVLVFIQWAWAYLTYQRGARLITDDFPSAASAGATRRPDAVAGTEPAGPVPATALTPRERG